MLERQTSNELINKLICAETHNNQLKNIIAKRNGSCSKNSKSQKPFDFSKAHFRHVFLKLYYLGWNYQGFASQEDSSNTIEFHIFNALVKTCLIKDRESSNYHRCGRTDKGVSSFSQVISIDLRSKFAEDSENNKTENELNYCKLLNSLLPHDIKFICWCSVDSDVSARFDCKSRTYKYFFPRGTLNIQAMEKGLSFIKGSHDFRNFCKMDVGNGVLTYVRNLITAKIEKCSPSAKDSSHEMLQLIIVGNAFLWHQIRCIVGILLLIGQNKEQPEIIEELLDVEKNSRKPDYNLASEVPLNLFDSEYDNVGEWIYDLNAFEHVIETLQKTWSISSIKSTMIKSMLEELENKYTELFDKKLDYEVLSGHLLQGVKAKNYKCLMDRPKCHALEERIEHYIKKRKLTTAKQAK